MVSNFFAFHNATLNEYYTGFLDMPVGNGISDGSWIIYGAYITCGIVGPWIYTYPLFPGSWL